MLLTALLAQLVNPARHQISSVLVLKDFTVQVLLAV